MTDRMHQPRDSNGQFSTPVSSAQFEEFRRTMDHQFDAAKEAVDAAHSAIRELDRVHAQAHLREHSAAEAALNEARELMDERVKRVEGDISGRVRKLEDAQLISATKDDVAGVGRDVKGVGSRVNKTAIAVSGAGLVAVINFVMNLLQNNVV